MNTAQYYKAIDPDNRRLKLDDTDNDGTVTGFRQTNGFDGTTVNVFFANSGDLGFGRDMNCVKKGSNPDPDIACYVSNYGDILSVDRDDVDAIKAIKPTIDPPTPTNSTSKLVATVAMEYSKIDGASDPTKVVKFYAYNAAGNRIDRADLDNLGDQPLPQLCMICHGGTLPVSPDTKVMFPPGTGGNLNARFLPFDLTYYTFSSDEDKTNQHAKFKDLNKNYVVPTYTSVDQQPINDLMNAWYPTTAENPDEQVHDAIVKDWGINNASRAIYQQVIGRTCRGCHITSPFSGNQFSNPTQLSSSVQYLVCNKKVMPHAVRTNDIFWTSTNMAAILGSYGSASKWSTTTEDLCALQPKPKP